MTPPLPLPRSLYADTARPAIDCPALEGGVSRSVAIVGGGFTGLSAALHLQERGIDSVVVEAQSEIGWGASGRNGGQVNPGIYPDPDQVLADFGPDMGQRMLTFSSAAPDKVFALVKRLGIDCEAAQTGTLRVAANARMLDRVRQTLTQLQRTGSPATWLDAEALATATGTSRYVGGIRFPQGGKVNPLGYARGLAEAARKAGAILHAGTPALHLSRQGQRWRVETPRGHIDCDHLVLATNAYSGDLWPRLRESVVPVYSTIAATAPLAGDLARTVMPSGSVLYEVAHNTVYYRLDHANRLLMGGRSLQRDARGLADADHLVSYARKLWPQLAGTAWTHVWNGKVAVTTDHHIHLHEPAENLHICLGYNGRGVAMATAMGEVIAQRIAGAGASDLPMPVTDIRPVSFHRFARLGVAVRLAYGGMRDRLGI